MAKSREAGQTWSFRGSKSRNKVSVGEPAEGSFMNGLLTSWTLVASETMRSPPPWVDVDVVDIVRLTID